jgi:hypothetical protein
VSYDCYMKIDAGGNEPATVCDIGNYTSNVSPMWMRALGGARLSDLDGRSGRDLIPIFEAAVSHIRNPDNVAAYRAMEPANGWGSHDGAARYLEKILEACRKHPKALLRVSA